MFLHGGEEQGLRCGQGDPGYALQELEKSRTCNGECGLQSNSVATSRHALLLRGWVASNDAGQQLVDGRLRQAVTEWDGDAHDDTFRDSADNIGPRMYCGLC